MLASINTIDKFGIELMAVSYPGRKMQLNEQQCYSCCYTVLNFVDF